MLPNAARLRLSWKNRRFTRYAPASRFFANTLESFGLFRASEDRDLSRHVIDVACALRTLSRWRRFSMDQSQIAKMLASPRIVDDRASSGGPSSVERLTARKPGPRIAQRSVTMDCQIRNQHVRYREHIFLRENCCCCAVKQMCASIWSSTGCMV